ncbi:lantipeptide synthetase [Spongiactinospora gelatinilytica]|uniref:non-specific serine/threonine protein kinase n=1 Tax=Spongiactinospora gelatinilytica TaxID=2666298 RepID=A0A2W2G6Q0_9ACTN|nr:class III lanthionine synthetase LanKC [Spongiactinospora gelatinilytica]PZG43921.1 lantipeptide synthetase [Spongiactinospora gelatinilytica]
MDQYELYCLADPHFYDTLPQSGAPGADFAVTRRPVPEGWAHQPTDTWMYYAPTGEPPLPAQGWKIHVSARVDDAERALAAVWDYCVPRGIAFKFLRGAPVVIMLNSKAASRASSGKLVTIYPRDEGRLELILKELHELLHGVTGPYILSDLRYGEGPLFVRYGGFAERHTLSGAGERVLAVEDGDGRLVPDVRNAIFSVPPWTTLPAFLEPHLAARNAVTTTGLPYQVENVLHFSNGGGVYLARDTRTGERVVLKEARPHAGLDAAGRDAVARLAHERDILARLAGLPAAPALRDYFALGEHRFLVMEFIDGNPLQRRLVQRYPFTRADCDAGEVAEYTGWALATLERVQRAVDSLHERGVVFGDLHPDNILITTDAETGEERVVLIDYEVATLAGEGARAALAHPAFSAPPDRQGVEVDDYAMACLRLGLFAPQCTIMLPLHRTKARHLGTLVSETFPVPSAVIDTAISAIEGDAGDRTGAEGGTAGGDPLAESPLTDASPALAGTAVEIPVPNGFTAESPVLAGSAVDMPVSNGSAAESPVREGFTAGFPVLGGSAAGGPGGEDAMADLPIPGAAPWDELRDAMGRAIAAAATPGRQDRLFPGDIAQFRPGRGLSVAYGAAGVLYALAEAGLPTDPAHHDWLRARAKDPEPGSGLGFYDGLHGVAHVLHRLGHRSDALDLLDVCLREKWEDLEPALSTGLSGLGLNLMHLGAATGETELTRAAHRAVDICAERLGGPEDVPETSGGTNPRAGLMHGASGPALLFLAAHRRTADPALLDLAGTAIRQDLRRCRRAADGSLQVNQGWRLLPYLDEGSVGIGVVLAEYLALREDPELAAELDALRMVARSGFFVQPGLFTGRAGIIAALGAGLRGPDAGDHPDPLIDRQVRGLAWHALPYRGGLAFPGDQLLRLSMDFATGTAGVLFALATVMSGRPVRLPLLPAATPRPVGHEYGKEV